MTSSVLENPASTKYLLIPFQCNKINNKDTETYVQALHMVHSAWTGQVILWLYAGSTQSFRRSLMLILVRWCVCRAGMSVCVGSG